MKLSAICLLLPFLLLSGCKGKSAKDLIVNNWTLTSLKDERTNESKMSEEEIKHEVGNLHLHFTKDGRYILMRSGRVVFNRNYVLSEDGKLLSVLREEHGGTDRLSIELITTNKLVLIDRNGDGPATYYFSADE